MIQLKYLLNEILTDEQNCGLKSIYIFVRDILWDIRSELLAEGITQELLFLDPKHLVAQFWAKYVPPTGTRKGLWFISIIWPQEYLKKFPNLDSELKIVIKPRGTTFALERSGDKIDTLLVPMKSLLGDSDTIKSLLQHEIQHIINWGVDVEEDGEGSKQFMTWFKYLSNGGELNAHAKQFAYLYYKQFPNDIKLDGKKFREFIVPNIKGGFISTFNFYLACGERTNEMKIKWKLGDETVLNMINVYKKFIQLLEEYFQNFIRK